RPSEVPFFSTVTGDWLDTTELDAGYWFRNLRATHRPHPPATSPRRRVAGTLPCRSGKGRIRQPRPCDAALRRRA
ncbi:hypothetical protein ABTY53_08945, partial [Streptomyces noursei]|uniref:hypothetical protein n=1 Tax=Streptomyces noursei TaxID=1971 RepID=UPI00331A6BFD